ncbi:MAG: TetR/AcrR family transcriptional regulator [Erythrobacter sp.]|nr:TetR/AcrR family transcriptional regulator [Erythrobacter sp.]
MSIIGPETAALAENAPSRQPRQGRSLASYERMLEATKSLMLERGEDFTLQDVSERGSVSIGSIYLRFESKDRLMHAVIAQELSGVIAGEKALLDQVLAQSSNLAEFLPRYIDGYSRFLAANAPLLRTIMQRASIDQAVSGPGRETARRSAAMSVDAILSFRDEIGGHDHKKKAEAVFQIIFATMARQFGLGATAESGDADVWSVTKGELAQMALAYLRFDG